MELSRTITESQTIEEIVKVINSGGSSSYDGNEIAGQYAFDAATDPGQDSTIENIESQLEYLSEDHGAIFDYQSALNVAVNLLKEFTE